MSGELLLEAVPGVGLGAGEAFVEDTRQGVDVGAGIGRAGLESLRGHVGPTAND